MKFSLIFSGMTTAAALLVNISAADTVFSGPQAGEQATAFKVLDLTPGREGKQRDPILENAGAPTALVFVHAVERSLVPLLRVLDQYGALRIERIKTEVVFLFADRLQGEQRVKAAVNSLKLASRIGLSLEGAEGPGNYGLNKECMMTVVVTKGNRVTDNFALLQPGIADAPKVIAALARACGDENPPTIEDLAGRSSGTRDSMRAPDRGTAPKEQPVRGAPAKSEDKFPGAVPTDARVNSLLRRIIRPTNDVATVDALRTEMQTYVKENHQLTQQAVDGWVRVLHFGDRYGTEYSRKIGRELMEELKSSQHQK